MRRLLPDPPSSPVGTLQQSQRSPHAVPEDSKEEPGLLYSISPALELQQTTGSRSLSRTASSRSRAGSISRPTTLPPRPPPLGAVPKKKKTVEDASPSKAIAPPVVSAPAQPSTAVTGLPPPPAPPVPENVMSFPVHSLTRRSAPSRGVAATRPPIAPRPELFEIYKNSLLAGMAAGNVELTAPPSEPMRGVVGRIPAVSGGQLVDVLANRRRVMALSDGDETDH